MADSSIVIRMKPVSSAHFTVAIRSRAIRVLAAAALLAAAAPGIYAAYRIFRADRIARTDLTPGGFTAALRVDPSNSRLWWQRGRLHHFSVEEPDLDKAAADYRKAVSLNPRLAQAWVGLSDCLERSGDLAGAERSLERALSVHRYSPLTRWQAGNFYLRQGRLQQMYESFKLASQYDPSKLPIAIQVAWKADADQAGILEKLVPDDADSCLKYLNFLVSQNELDLAAPVWRRWKAAPVPEGTDPKPSVAFPYVDRLLNASRISEALAVWNDSLVKTRTGLSDPRVPADSLPPETALLWNGSFELDALNGGFDWRYKNGDIARFRLDVADRMHRLKSLKIVFGGVNSSAAFLQQFVPIPAPGPYQLDFYLHAENLTTDQRPYVAVRGYPEVSATLARSEAFPPDTPWKKMSLRFDAKPGCEAILLSVRRDRSAKFDRDLKGSLWLDGFTLRPAAPAQAGTQTP